MPEKEIRATAFDLPSALLDEKNSIIDGALDCVVTFDNDGRIVDSNRATHQTFGQTAAELRGRYLADTLIAAGCRQSFRFCLSDLVATGSAPFLDRRVELTGQRAGADRETEEFPIEFSVARIVSRRPPSARAAFAAYVRDVSESRKIEALLRESESRFRRIFESSVVGVLYWGIHGEITDANDAFLRMTRYTRADLVAGRMNWHQMTPPEYHHLNQAAADEIRRTGACQPFEKEYLRKDGTRVPVIVASASLLGSVVRGVAMIVDISDRKRWERVMKENHLVLISTEKELRASHDKLETILFNISNGVTVQDRSFDLVYINDCAARFLGYESTAEMLRVPKNVRVKSLDFRDEKGYPLSLSEFPGRRLLAGLPAPEIVLQTRNMHGQNRWFNVRAIALHDAQGQIEAAVSISTDITEQRRIESLLREACPPVAPAPRGQNNHPAATTPTDEEPAL